MHCRIAVALFIVVVTSLWRVSVTDAASRDETAIRQALTECTQHFNARHGDQVCQLFAPELRYDYRLYPERGFNEICELLRRSLTDRSKTYTYSLNIKEVLLSGDLAIVRLVWTRRADPSGWASA